MGHNFKTRQWYKNDLVCSRQAQHQIATEENGPLYPVASEWLSRSRAEKAQLVVYVKNPWVANSSCREGHLWEISYMGTTIDCAAADRRSW